MSWVTNLGVSWCAKGGDSTTSRFSPSREGGLVASLALACFLSLGEFGVPSLALGQAATGLSAPPPAAVERVVFYGTDETDEIAEAAPASPNATTTYRDNNLSPLTALEQKALPERPTVAPTGAGESVIDAVSQSTVDLSAELRRESLEPGESAPVRRAQAELEVGGVDGWLSTLKGSSVRLMLLLGLVSLAPAAFLMTTSYVRIVVVLSLLKQALGNQQALPTQATTALALFMTGLVMTPVWQDVYRDAIQPYRESGGSMSAWEAWTAGVQPVRQFMSRQIDRADNGEDVWLFYRHLPAEQQSNPPQTYDDVPLQVLLPAFLLSELKTAFLIGFQIYLPFLVLDFVIATVTTSMGLTTMQPSSVALPFKLLLFVLVDGWRLVAGTLLESFQAL